MKYLITSFFVLTTMALTGQEIQYVSETFRGTRVINGQSVATLKEGEMDYIISHRFGRLNGGFYELFGLDQASMRMGTDGMNAGTACGQRLPIVLNTRPQRGNDANSGYCDQRCFHDAVPVLTI